MAAGSQGRRPARGKDFLGDACDPGTELVLGLNPFCSKREEEEAEKDFGAREGLSPCPASPGDAWGTGSAGEQRRSWGAPGGERPPPPITQGWEKCFLGGDTQKIPVRCNSKGLKANAALERGNGGEQESLEERGNGKKERDGGKRGIEGAQGWGTHTHTRVGTPRGSWVSDTAGELRR